MAFRRALKYRPDFAGCPQQSGTCCAPGGRLDQAAGHYEAGSRQPGLCRGPNNLGIVRASWETSTNDLAG